MFCDELEDLFRTKTHCRAEVAAQYLGGLIQAPRRNMERMEEVVEQSDYQRLQQFLSDSPWDEERVWERVAREVDGLLGGTPESALLIDETSFAKKGKASVGVSRQWSGRLGKVENCQVGVFAALSAGSYASPIDVRLFLPRTWSDDEARCRRARIPEDRVEYRTKVELALEMIRHQCEIGTRFAWIGADGLYGDSWQFCRGIDALGKVFVVDAPRDRLVYLEPPNPSVPERNPKGGRPPTRLKAHAAPFRLDQILHSLEPDDWQSLHLRDGDKGPIQADFHHRRVWLWDEEANAVHHWWLLVRREQETGEVRYAISNASSEVEPIKLARMQAQRFWIESSFRDAKQEAGMGEYQARGWRAWHHHMALVGLAMLFMLKHRMIHRDSIPLLSCHDVKILLAHFLPKRNASTKEVLRQMVVRHQKRDAATKSAARRKRRPRAV